MTTDDDGDSDTDADDQYVCGAETAHTDAPCQFPVSAPDGRCGNHPPDGSGPADGVGSGDSDHSKGGDPDADVQARTPDHHKPSMDHGFHAVDSDPSGTLAWIEDNDPRGHDWIRSKWRGLLDRGDIPEDDPQADDLLQAVLYDYLVRSWTGRQIQEGLTQTQTRTADSGATFEVEVEQPGNLPADRLARRSEEIKRKNGVLNDPESQKAEAMGWGQAAKRVAQRVDSDAENMDVDVDGERDVDANATGTAAGDTADAPGQSHDDDSTE